MSSWLLFSSFALVAWGLWGFFSKVTTHYLDPRSAFIYELIGALAIGAVILLAGFRPETNPRGVMFGVLTGLFLGIGHLLFFVAASRGKVSIVILLTGLYPLITIVLAFLVLHETISLKQAAGMICAVAAMILFSL